jgi:hypothetical protein
MQLEFSYELKEFLANKHLFEKERQSFLSIKDSQLLSSFKTQIIRKKNKKTFFIFKFIIKKII